MLSPANTLRLWLIAGAGLRVRHWRPLFITRHIYVRKPQPLPMPSFNPKQQPDFEKNTGTFIPYFRQNDLLLTIRFLRNLGLFPIFFLIKERFPEIL